MTDQTYPSGGVSEDAAVMQRMQNFLAQSEDPAPQEAKPQQTAPEATVAQPIEQPQSPAEDVTPDDIPDDAPPVQPAVDAFEIEIVHDGKQVKLNREETIKHARQGFDYTQKTQAIAAKDRQVQAQIQKLSQIEQVAPQVQSHLAEVKAIESQLSQYQNVNWIQLANDSPGEYTQHRARFDMLRDSYAQARGRYEQVDSAVKSEMQRLMVERLRTEAARLPDLVPEWKDDKKLDQARSDISRHFTETYGLSPEELNQEANTALKVAVMYKAMKYDQLLRAKGDKSKQLRTAPPVTVPGAKSVTAKADDQRNLGDKLRKTGDIKDAAALLLNRWK